MKFTLPGFEALLQPPETHDPPPALAVPDGTAPKLAQITDHFNQEGFTLPVRENAEEREKLSEREMMFLSRETITRFLIATKGDATAATSRLERTMVWRRTEKVEDVEAMAADCGPESTTGKNMLLGYSTNGRPVVYFFPNRNTTPIEKRRAVHAVFMLERASDLMQPGVNNSMVIFSFVGKRQGPPTSVSVARQTLHILSEYYPERLGLCYFLEMPFIVKAFVNLMWPFVDPATKKKVRFDSNMVKEGHIAQETLLKECGGSLDLPYEHEVYWPVLIKLCMERRKAQLETWRRLGEPMAGREEATFKAEPISPDVD